MIILRVSGITKLGMEGEVGVEGRGKVVWNLLIRWVSRRFLESEDMKGEEDVNKWTSF